MNIITPQVIDDMILQKRGICMLEQFRKKLNFRDLGGYPTQDGKKVKMILFYRGGAPLYMNIKELEILRGLGLRTVLDLRTTQERLMKPDPFIPNVKVLEHSGTVSQGGEEIDFSLEGMSRIGEGGKQQLSMLEKYYARMPFNNQAFQVMFQEIMMNQVPMFIHCASGKDRTGVASMLILLALGVDRDTVLQDYLLTNEYRQEQIQNKLSEDADIIKDYPEREILDRMLAGVSERIGNVVLDAIFNEYGSLDAYFENEFGLDENKRKELINLYTE